MTKNQLELFAWRPPSAKILPFPANRLVGKVRDVAVKYQRQPSEKARRTYWERVVLGLAKRMAATGMTENEIAGQIDRFSDRVAEEIYRLESGGNAKGA